MSERYNRLFVLPEAVYATESPVMIESGALLKDNKTGKILAQLKMVNISDKKIKAVKVRLNCYDTARNPIDEPVVFEFLDLDVNRDVPFGAKTPIPIPNISVREFEAKVVYVVFEDHNSMDLEAAFWRPLPKQKELKEALGEALSKQYKRDISASAQYEPITFSGFWKCYCGALNHTGEHRCHSCSQEKEKQFLALDYNTLAKNLAAFETAEAEKNKAKAEIARLEREHQEEIARTRAKKLKRNVIITAPIVCAVVAILIVVFTIVIPNIKYNDAIALMDAGNIVEAYEALIALDGYKDSADKAASIYEKYKLAKLKSAEVGDYVLFGKYKQYDYISNGQQDIKWLVLSKEGTQILIISKDVLDCRSFNDYTWSTSPLRSWLNDHFFNTAFSADEKALVSTTRVTAQPNPDYVNENQGLTTQDKVFLLSVHEVKQYLPFAGECKPTDFAVSRGALADANGNCEWWLRTAGKTGMTFVDSKGRISTYGQGIYADDTGVRPAVWIDLNA